MCTIHVFNTRIHRLWVRIRMFVNLGAHTAHDVLYSISIAILSFFLIELLMLMAAGTPCLFFRNLFYGAL